MVDNVYKKFLASAPLPEREYRTLEFYHSQFPKLYRLTKDFEDQTLTLESDAPRNPGESVLFDAVSMEITEPGENEGGESILSATVGALGGEIHDAVKSITGDGFFESIQVVYRKFYSGDLSGPKVVQYLTASSVNFESYEQARIVAEDDDLANKSSGEIYTLERFPGLVGI